MMVHGKHNSPIITLREKYSGHISYDVVNDISNILKGYNWQYSGLDLTTSIFFPENMLSKISDPGISASLADCNDFSEFKSLLEFIAHRSLTELEDEKHLDEFISDIGEILEANNGTIPIEAYIHLIAPAGFNASEIEAILV